MDIYQCEWVRVGFPMPFCAFLRLFNCDLQETIVQLSGSVIAMAPPFCQNSAQSGLKFGPMFIPNRVAIYSKTNRTIMARTSQEYCLEVGADLVGKSKNKIIATFAEPCKWKSRYLVQGEVLHRGNCTRLIATEEIFLAL